ncbi:hypothetical protein ACPWSR_04970 [Alloiococcus sp. CFN-8]|uniref:hypothetical protein n=1 Tax=Alloiococcus sp. CFN-8 TaxID=3416081 RepID=UPI003CEC261A
MSKEKGYIIKENAPIYLTKDMDKTLRWFKEVLGWHGGIDERDAEGKGTYGCAFSLPQEIGEGNIDSFTGIHMFYGEPKKGLLSFMYVEGIEEFRSFILNNNWDQVSDITMESWGGKTFNLTTIDGYVLYCFQ